MLERLRPVAILAVAAAACGPGDVTTTGPTPVTVPQIASSAPRDVPSALVNRADASFPAPLIDPARIRSGGPPPDGIPPIDAPSFLSVPDVGFLDDAEPVLSFEIDGEARAYPIQVMIWHEIVNDTIAGIPVTVTYCPLCSSAVAYDRRVDDQVLDFGTSGLLYNSALVMYDRQTESLWSHFTGQAVVGHLTGTRLATFPVATISWATFREAHPDGLVLSRDTGFDRDYGRNPYPGYDDVATSPFLFDGAVDGRLAAKERVIGIDDPRAPVALPLESVSRTGVRTFDVGDRTMVAFVAPGTSSPLDGATVAAGRDIGATGVFVAKLDDRALDFRRVGDAFVDEQTQSRWNVLGQAVSGPLAGRRLVAIPHVDTFWFAWGAFHPESLIVS